MRLRYICVLILFSCMPLQSQPGDARSGVVWNIDNLTTIGGHAVSVFGYPVVTDLPEGRAIVFDGVDDGVIVRGCPLDGSSEFTVELVFRPDASYPKNVEQRFLHIQKPGIDLRRIMLETRLTGTGQWYVDTHIRADSMKLTCLAADYPHPVGPWYHLAFVYKDGVATHYVDGVREMSGRIGYIPLDSAVVSLGMRMNNIYHYKGAIRTVRMTRRALEPSEFMADGSCMPLFLDAEKIAEAHAALKANTPGKAAPVRMLMREADSVLGLKPLSVMDKVQTPPSGNKHDFLSMGPYWWPDSSKADGLPYVRFDGRRNPEYHTITDQEYFTRTIDAAEKLSVAFAISDDSRYAAGAAKVLRVWFLDEDTKMNPNLNHAQYIPGINTGRGIGIIETRQIFKLLDALCLLEPSEEWTDTDAKKMRTWIEDYYRWLTTHPYGIDESNEKNNHGTWYDVQVTSLALYLGKMDDARKYLEQAKEKRIGAQIESDGRQPLELARTKSWDYSLMNLSAFVHLAQLGERAGVDLWNYESPKGGSLRKALGYLLRYAEAPATWEYQNLHPIEPHTLVPLIVKGQKRFADEKYSEWLRTIPASKKDPGIEGLYK